ncbi:hypothetical protein [Streptomyces sp. NBC_00370]|uniref:hypothetical protein n=1 Tax=Streptomyces sp. NBC_00370 TaxID=2975728 RepID=UPI002E26F6F5
MTIADSLIGDFDPVEFLQELCALCVNLLGVSAAGILLAGEKGILDAIAASDDNAHLLEPFALQYDQGPCVEAYRSETACLNIDLSNPTATAA